MGNVVVINKQKQEKLLTPELNWKPVTKKVYTDKRVTILSQLTGEKLYGIGLDANQDFSNIPSGSRPAYLMWRAAYNPSTPAALVGYWNRLVYCFALRPKWA